MTGVALAGVAAGLAIAVPVGAVAVVIVTLAATRGFRVGAAAGLGTATVDGLYAGVAVLAGAALAPLIGHVQTPLRVLSVVVLVAVAASLLVAGLRAVPPPDDPPPGRSTGAGRAYLTVLGLTAVNPATLVYFAALVAGAGAPAHGAAAGTVFVAGALVGSAGWQLVLAGVGAGLGSVVTGRAARRWTSLVGAGAVIALAARSALG